jgi:antagonist of KipI
MSPPFIQVVRPGLLTTIQDLGRWGLQTYGVPVAGPMDTRAHRLANWLVGNADQCATLEITLVGPELIFDGGTTIAMTGAECEVTLDEVPIPANAALDAAAGSRLRIGGSKRGTRAYLAVAGGIDVAPLFSSRSTHLLSRMGGVGGRALVAGDRLPVGQSRAKPSTARRARPVTLPDGGARLRVLPGPHDDLFTAHGHETLLASRYTVTPQSDRMAYRLDGPALDRIAASEIISDATAIGSLQVPASGQPILLMADRQTSGGYPKIATVITADLGLAGQLAPGDWIEFVVADRARALRALVAQEQALFRA